MTTSEDARAALDRAAIDSAARELMRRRFDAVDAMDLDGFLAVHADDSRLLFGARPPVVGKADAAVQVRAFWSMIAGLRHHIARVSMVGSLVFVESMIDYERHDGRTVQVACCDVFEVAGDLIRETRAYLDQSDVFAD